MVVDKRLFIQKTIECLMISNGNMRNHAATWKTWKQYKVYSRLPRLAQYRRRIEAGGTVRKRVETDKIKDPSPWLNLIPLLSLMSRAKIKLYLVPQQHSCETKHNLDQIQPYPPLSSLLPPRGFSFLVSTSKPFQIPLCLEPYRAIVFRCSSAEFGGYSSTFTL